MTVISSKHQQSSPFATLKKVLQKSQRRLRAIPIFLLPAGFMVSLIVLLAVAWGIGGDPYSQNPTTTAAASVSVSVTNQTSPLPSLKERLEAAREKAWEETWEKTGQTDIQLFAKELPSGTQESEKQQTAEVAPLQKPAVTTGVIQRDPKVLANLPKVAIVIDDLGLNPAHSKRLASLPGPLTLSYLPYGRGLEKQTHLVRQAGHELFLHLPMEPLDNKKNPGPNALRVNLSANEITRAVQHNLSQFEGFVGVNNHMGSRFTAHAPHMRTVMEALKQRNLIFLDSVTNPRSVAGQIAHEARVPFARRDVFLDHQRTAEFIQRQLRETLRVAKTKGSAIVIAHPHKITLTHLEKWLPGLSANGVQLVPLSEIISTRYEQFVQDHPLPVDIADVTHTLAAPKSAQKVNFVRKSGQKLRGPDSF